MNYSIVRAKDLALWRKNLILSEADAADLLVWRLGHYAILEKDIDLKGALWTPGWMIWVIAGTQLYGLGNPFPSPAARVAAILETLKHLKLTQETLALLLGVKRARLKTWLGTSQKGGKDRLAPPPYVGFVCGWLLLTRSLARPLLPIRLDADGDLGVRRNGNER